MKESNYEEEEEDFDNKGMVNQLRPKSKGIHNMYIQKVSDELEHLFSQLESKILSVAWENEMSRECKNIWCMGEKLNNLKDSDPVIVPTDNTNSFRSVSTRKYMTMIKKHLIETNKILFEKATVLVDTTQIGITR